MTNANEPNVALGPGAFALKSQRVWLGGDVMGFQPAFIVVDGGIIQEILPYDALFGDADAGLPVTDVGNLAILPGLVDSHVHINEPGRTEWEGFETATKAALAGGITTLVDMPLNCIPVTTSLAALKVKLAETDGKLYANCGFYGGVIPGNAAELKPMVVAGVLGFKCFLCPSGIDEFPNVTEADLRVAMPILAELGVPLLVHAEQESCVAPTPGSSRQYADYLGSRPDAWEREAIAMMIRLSAKTGCPVHIVHLSSATALPLLAEAKAKGVPITVETCPHYLTLTAESVPEGQTQYKCAPPIRDQSNQNALWQALQDGVIDFIVSDHSPCTPELKCQDSGDFMAAWGGISSVQFGLGLLWKACQERNIPLSMLLPWLTERPAQRIGLGHQKGRVAPGYDADFTLWDPEASQAVDALGILHRHKLTPYLGAVQAGQVQAVYLAGQLAFSRQDNIRFEHHTVPLGKAVLGGVFT